MQFIHHANISGSIVAIALLAAGCTGGEADGNGASALGGTDVEGKMLHSPETFSGESTAGVNENGSMTLVSDRGVRCDGPYHQVQDSKAGEVNAETSHNGVATLTCNDGRKGSVMFTLGADQAVGTGMLGQDIVTLRMVE